MAAKGTIESRLRLDKSDFSKNLKAAREEAVAEAAKIRKAILINIRL